MAVLQYKDPVTGQLKDLPLINQGVKEAPIDGKQYARKDGEWSEIDVDSNVDLSDYTTKEELNNALLGKVDKQEGKQLTTEDFTTVLKEKLEGLSNYNDTEIRNAIDSLESAFNTLVEGNATVAIDTFNEIVAFLKNIENSQDLDSIIAGINTTISKVEAKIPDTNNLLSKDGGTMNNTNLIGNLNADMLDGLHIDEFLIKGPRVYSKEDFDTKYRFASMYSTDYMSPVDGAYNYGQVLSFVDNCSTTQFYCPDNTGLIYFRNKWGTDTYGSENFANVPWYEIITSKNIGSQTVAAANKLSTTRYLWGQPFDGSGDVKGIIKGVQYVSFETYDYEGGSAGYVGRGGTNSNDLSITTYGENCIDFSTNSTERMRITKDGLIGIGTITPVYNFHVVGSSLFNDYGQHSSSGIIIIRNDAAITGWERAIFAHFPNLGVGARANFHIGKESTAKNGGYISYYHAGDSSGNNCMTIGLYDTDDILNVTANRCVGINTTTPRGTLDVNGSSVIDGYVYLKGVNRRIYFYNSEGEGLLIDNNGINWHDANDSFAFNIMTFSSNKKVGINTTTPQEALDVNGNIYIGRNGEIKFYDSERFDKNGNLRFGKISNNWGIFNYSGSKLFTVMHSNGYVGIGIADPEHTLDVNGSSIFRNHVFVKKYHYIFMNTGEEGVYYTDDGLYWHDSNNTYVRHLIKFNNTGDASFTGKISMDGADQINGNYAGIALNFYCGKYVNTSICDGQAHLIMRVFGESRQVAIGPSAKESPQGRLNVDGDVVFENARFITTSGFVDGNYAYSHAIYGGCHGINVCEFYENEFQFKTNGGDTTSLILNRYFAEFNGTVRTFNCHFAGVWNGVNRFKLARDGESNTWLQAGTDTTNDNGRLYMSGISGTLLHQFNVWASISNFKGSIIAEGDVTAYSDIRLKNRIETVNNVLDTIDTLDVFRYTWKDREDKSVHIGVSAQQVQTIYPEFVLTSSSEDGTDYLTVNYAALATCIAIQGIKELVKKGDERDKRIAALEEEVISLKEQLRYGNK